MNHTILNIFNRNITGTHLAAVGAAFLLLTAIKKYTSGAVCNVKKDLSGKVAVITGGNSGIGRQTALELARQNCDLIIGARDKGKLQQVIVQIRAINPKIKVICTFLDLGDRKSIQKFSQLIYQNCDKVDFLVNNAAVIIIPERKQTKDGLQMQMGVNHFGHFYLTYLVFPLLKKSDFFRVVNVSSVGHKRAKGLDFNDMHLKNNYSGAQSYRRSKLANIYFTRTLQQKINQSRLNGITTSIHPGLVRTDGSRDFSLSLKLFIWIFYPLFYLISKSSKQGAQTTLYALLQDPQKLIPGEYYADCKVAFSTEISKNLDEAEKLWKVSEQIWNIKFNME